MEIVVSRFVLLWLFSGVCRLLSASSSEEAALAHLRLRHWNVVEAHYLTRVPLFARSTALRTVDQNARRLWNPITLQTEKDPIDDLDLRLVKRCRYIRSAVILRNANATPLVRVLVDEKRVRHLGVIGVRDDDATIIAILRNATWLQSLNLSNNSWLSDEDVTVLQKLLEIRHLNLSYTNISDRCGSVLGEMKAIKYLEIDGTGITDRGLEAVCKLPNLQVISMNGLKGVSATTLRRICENRTVQAVYAIGTAIRGKDLEQCLAKRPSMVVEY